MKLTSKQLNAIKDCKTADEIVAKANENGFEISSEEAGKLLSKGVAELSDKRLSDVFGGDETQSPDNNSGGIYSGDSGGC